mmetsp:Transcript_60689/g.104525  ORF Transcript_60689/g.104525 Transcript_60689/m.104525 type:complete len:227 (+) Transcript_60689:43-723(+)
MRYRKRNQLYKIYYIAVENVLLLIPSCQASCGLRLGLPQQAPYDPKSSCQQSSALLVPVVPGLISPPGFFHHTFLGRTSPPTTTKKATAATPHVTPAMRAAEAPFSFFACPPPPWFASFLSLSAWRPSLSSFADTLLERLLRLRTYSSTSSSTTLRGRHPLSSTKSWNTRRSAATESCWCALTKRRRSRHSSNSPILYPVACPGQVAYRFTSASMFSVDAAVWLAM